MAVRAARRSRWWALVLTAITTCTATFPAALARKAQARLERLGVEVRTRQAVTAMRETGRAAPLLFRYVDKGNMAVVGRGFAILDAGAVKLSGLSAWLVWAFIHIAFLPAPGNRRRVWTQWLWSYCTRQQSSQLIVEPHESQGSVQLPSQSDGDKVHATAHPQ